jgi:hypothetical protein
MDFKLYSDELVSVLVQVQKRERDIERKET